MNMVFFATLSQKAISTALAIATSIELVELDPLRLLYALLAERSGAHCSISNCAS
jgi:hypothetical protein